MKIICVYGDKKSKTLIGWCNNKNILLKILANKPYGIKILEYDDVVKKYGNISELELVEYDNDVTMKRDIIDIISTTEDEELYNLASSISYMATIYSKYNTVLTDKELKAINKSISTMKYLFDNISKDGLISNSLDSLSKLSKEELSKQSEFIKSI